VGRDTRLEFVTEGIMTNMLQSDPELAGIDLLIFDEYHERSIHADTALAFSLECQEALRDDLKLVVMSATLDQQALQQLLPQAAYIESHGRAYPVEQRYQPMSVNDRLVPFVQRQVEQLLSCESGSILVFLPGSGAIRQIAQGLAHWQDEVDICPLFGQLSFAEQEKAIKPAADGRRKVVLATNIAETSLTIEGIRIVVDSGLERVARFDLQSGITRLEQVRVAQSSAVQRAGRAGRLEAGLCVRLYSESQFNQMAKVPMPEIMQADLSSLALELALWGCSEAAELHWLDLPPRAALAQGRALLSSLALLTEEGQVTEKARQLQKIGTEPRVGAMLLQAAELGSPYRDTALVLAALLEEPERPVLDISHSLYRFLQGRHPKQAQLKKRVQALAGKLAVSLQLDNVDETYTGLCLAFAFPDRIAQLRRTGSGRFLLANGHGAAVDGSEPLADEAYLVVVDLLRSGRDESRIYIAAALDIQALQQLRPDLFVTRQQVDWDEKRGRLLAQEQRCLGHQTTHLVITSKELPEPGAEQMSAALLSYVRRSGLEVLNWSEKSIALRERIRCAQEWLPEKPWPDMSDVALLDNLEQWLEPYLNQAKSARDLKSVDLFQALLAYLGWPLNQEIDQLLPVSYTVATGNRKKIRYQLGQEPLLSVRMQEMFGQQDSPLIADGRKKLVLELLSPAQRPLQVTSDLAGFWAGAYKEVQKEMKGRYPKHPWPDNPAEHIATTKTKRQLNS
jgi:ATP-dependent helicase HrpB